MLASDLGPLVREIDAVAAKLETHVRGLLPLLSEVRRTLPPLERDKQEAEVTAMRVGRVVQFLQAGRMLTKSGFGSALALVARATWETWIDAAWTLYDPAQRYKRANAVWVAAMAQQTGLLQAFLKRDGRLEPDKQAALAENMELVRTEKDDPAIYEEWFNPDGTLRRGLHQIRASRQHGVRAGELDRAKDSQYYSQSYDFDYTVLSAASHGEGTPLLRLIGETSDRIAIDPGEGQEAGAYYFVLLCLAACWFVYEVQTAYQSGTHDGRLDVIREELDRLRDRCTSWI